MLPAELCKPLGLLPFEEEEEEEEEGEGEGEEEEVEGGE